jgi:3-oxo-4-pregnene-20-carboxyl-CoA dehydrogenase alpha subunit
VRFTLDETQQAIAQLAGEVLDGAGADPPERAWKALGQAGMLSLAVPTGLGGDGLGIAEIAVLLTEIGRRAVPVPALSTLALGILPVARWGSREQQEDLLSGVPTEGAVLTAALREPSEPMPAAPRAMATPGDPTVVTGTKVGVPYAEQSHRVLVPVSLPAGGTAVAIVDPRARGVSLSRTPTSAGTPEYTLRMDGVRATGMLGTATARDIYRYAIAGACATGDGVLAGALALTAAHIGSREQFGRPLAAFQAVAQQIADVYVASRTVRLATLAACWRLSRAIGATADADLDVAAYWLAQEAPEALRTCHHLHGGLGLDISYPLHRYSALTRDLVRLLGGAEYRLERLGSRDVRRSV